MPAETALPRRPGFILATVVSVLLAVGIGGAIFMKPNGKKTRVEAAVTTSTVTTASPTTVGPPPDPPTTATTVASTTVPTTTVTPPTVAPPAVAPATTTTRPQPVTASSRPPPPTIPPTTVVRPPTTPPTAPPTTPAPPPTCAATMGSATPSSKPGSTDTVSITSNVPNTSGTIILHAKSGDQRYVVVTDAAGHALLPFSTGGFVVAYTVVVSVDVGGRASCSTSFTPQ